MVYDAGANIEEYWAASGHLGSTTRHHQDWFDENEEGTACRKNFIFERIRMIHPQNLVSAKLIVQRKLREMKDKWLRDKAKMKSRASLAARSPSASMIHCRLCADLSPL